MNIKDNIINYLYDKDFCMCMYDDYLYIFNYKYLEIFNENRIVVSVKNKTISLQGSELLIVRITKEELLIKGKIDSIETKRKDE